MMTPFLSNKFDRFQGIKRLYGVAAANNFYRSHIAIIGLGGVGSWAAEALIRSGIGTVTLLDMDDIEITNINRQLHALTSSLGKSKVAMMRQRLKDINPDAQIIAIEDFMSLSDPTMHLASTVSYVIEAIDNAKIKSACIASCRERSLPLLTIGSAGGKKDPCRIQVKDLGYTQHDPLLARVKTDLRRRHGLKRDKRRGRWGIRAVFSDEQISYRQATTDCDKALKARQGKMDCSAGLGSVSTVTASFGLVAASYVLDRLSVS